MTGSRPPLFGVAWQVAEFFELQGNIWRSPTDKEKIDGTTPASKRRLTRATTSRLQPVSEEDEKAAKAEAKAAFRSPKRSAADVTGRREGTAAVVGGMAKRLRGDEHSAAWTKLLEAPPALSEPSAWNQLVTQPLAEAAAFWGARAEKEAPETPESTAGSRLAIPRDLPLTRSGVSDVMGAIGLE